MSVLWMGDLDPDPPEPAEVAALIEHYHAALAATSNPGQAARLVERIAELETVLENLAQDQDRTPIPGR